MLLAYIHNRKGKNPEGASLGSLVTAFHDVYPGKKREPTVWAGAYLHRLIETVYIYIVVVVVFNRCYLLKYID